MSLLAALPASQLLIAAEDRTRVWNDFRVRGPFDRDM